MSTSTPILNATIAAIANRANYKSQRWVNELSNDIVGGSYSMNFLADDPTLTGAWSSATINAYHNARNPGSSTKYIINPNLWCKDIIDKLSCIVIAKDDCGTSWSAAGKAWRTRYGFIPITKRHVIACGHAFTHAQGTWSPSSNKTNSPPTRIRWRGTDGETVDRIQLHQATNHVSVKNTANAFGLYPGDLSVAVLDQDLPDTVYIPKFITKFVGIDYNLKGVGGPDIIVPSQEWDPTVATEQNKYTPYPTFSQEVYGYPKQHRMMIHKYSPGYVPVTSRLKYNLWGGDSGTAMLSMYRQELVITGILSGEWAKTYPKGSFTTIRDVINILIGLADSYAVSAGRMSLPTGYTIPETFMGPPF